MRVVPAHILRGPPLLHARRRGCGGVLGALRGAGCGARVQPRLQPRAEPLGAEHRAGAGTAPAAPPPRCVPEAGLAAAPPPPGRPPRCAPSSAAPAGEAGAPSPRRDHGARSPPAAAGGRHEAAQAEQEREEATRAGCSEGARRASAIPGCCLEEERRERHRRAQSRGLPGRGSLRTRSARGRPGEGARQMPPASSIPGGCLEKRAWAKASPLHPPELSSGPAPGSRDPGLERSLRAVRHLLCASPPTSPPLSALPPSPRVPSGHPNG